MYPIPSFKTWKNDENNVLFFQGYIKGHFFHITPNQKTVVDPPVLKNEYNKTITDFLNKHIELPKARIYQLIMTINSFGLFL